MGRQVRTDAGGFLANIMAVRAAEMTALGDVADRSRALRTLLWPLENAADAR
jgi:hypothetical protein